jgi:AmmeMemoRadiSam system protein A
MFTEEEKRKLMQLAKDAIEGVFFGNKDQQVIIPDNLRQKSGAFVTLKKKGELRGCIGYIKAVRPLDETVKEMAIQAAFHDPRFNPLNKNEMEDIEMEISVISPMKRIENIDEIEVGTHGIYIEKAGNSGLLLPQVATENHWDKKTFLEYTCWKAGLPKDAWKSKDTTIYIFSAEVF